MSFCIKAVFLLLSLLCMTLSQSNSSSILQQSVSISNSSTLPSVLGTQPVVNASTAVKNGGSKLKPLIDGNQKPIPNTNQVNNSQGSNPKAITASESESSSLRNATSQTETKPNSTKVDVTPPPSNATSSAQASSSQVKENQTNPVNSNSSSNLTKESETAVFVSCPFYILQSSLATAIERNSPAAQLISQPQMPSSSPIRTNYQAYKKLYQKTDQSSSYPVLRSTGATNDIFSQRSMNSPSTTQRGIYRELIYMSNVNLMNKHNSKSDRKFSMGLNQFADLSQSQFRQRYVTLKFPAGSYNQVKKGNLNLRGRLLQKQESSPYTIPPKILIDWKCYSRQTRSQGVCGSAYAISALHATELSIRINGRPSPTFSLQEIISCAKDDVKIGGCRGGMIEAVFDYIKTNGIGWKSLYNDDPNASQFAMTAKCNKDLISTEDYKKSKTFIRSWKYVKPGDCRQMVQLLKTRAMAVAVKAYEMQFYKEGTYTPTNKSLYPLDHAVTLLGYDPAKGYLIKNSWGLSWGIKGYGYVSAQAGPCDQALYPEI